MSEPTTNPTSKTIPSDTPSTKDLTRVVARFGTREQVEAAGYVFGAEKPAVGDEAVVYSRGGYRVGIISKVGRVNVTVTYTTETAIRDAADPRFRRSRPVRSVKAARFAEVAVRRKATAAPGAPMASGASAAAAAALFADSAAPADALPLRVTGPRQVDHNDECVGCGAQLSDPCHLTCPFETGAFGPAVLLRATVSRLRENPAGVGYDIGGALFAAALDLVGHDGAGWAADEARDVLTGFLVDQWGERAEPIRAEVVYRHGLFSDLPEIARSLFTAAARHDGIGVDPTTFGELPA